ncbi:hypothetical protein D3C87_1998800 [compost metagenome]
MLGGLVAQKREPLSLQFAAEFAAGQIEGVFDQGAHAFDVPVASHHHCNACLLAGVFQLTFEETAFEPQVTLQAT